MGLSPEIQETSVVSERHGFPFVGASVKNILVRLPGTSGSRAMLFTLTFQARYWFIIPWYGSSISSLWHRLYLRQS
jgi:hypothetical protein